VWRGLFYYIQPWGIIRFVPSLVVCVRISYKFLDEHGLKSCNEFAADRKATTEAKDCANSGLLWSWLSRSTNVSIGDVALFIRRRRDKVDGCIYSNANAKTIEQALFEAICRAGGVSKANSEALKKVGWARAARTDKGVHAVGQIVSLKISICDEIYICITSRYMV
jgi:hypothetical protein